MPTLTCRIQIHYVVSPDDGEAISARTGPARNRQALTAGTVAQL
jgi:hypothetical protein